MTDFFVTLPSNLISINDGSTNVPSDYSTRLPEPLIFRNKWTVGLHEILIAGEVLTVPHPLTFTITLNSGETAECTLPKGTYNTPAALMHALNSAVPVSDVKRARRSAQQQIPTVTDEQLAGIDVREPITVPASSSTTVAPPTNTTAPPPTPTAPSDVPRVPTGTELGEDVRDPISVGKSAEQARKEEEEKRKADEKKRKDEETKKKKQEAEAKKKREEQEKKRKEEEAEKERKAAAEAARLEADKKARELADKMRREAEAAAAAAAEAQRAKEEQERRDEEAAQLALARAAEEAAKRDQESRKRRPGDSYQPAPYHRIRPEDLPDTAVDSVTKTLGKLIVFSYDDRAGRVLVNFDVGVASVEFAPDIAYMCGLASEYLDDSVLAPNSPDCTNGKSLLFIYSDLCGFSVCGSQKTNLLRVIPFPALQNNSISQSFQNIRYCDVRSERIDSIRIQILDALGNRVHVAGYVCCVLHLQKKE